MFPGTLIEKLPEVFQIPWKSDWAGIVRRVQNDAEVNNTTINHDNQEYVPLESGDDERHGRYGST